MLLKQYSHINTMWLYCLNIHYVFIRSIFFNIFNYYKKRYKKLATRIAIVYINLLHISFLLLLGMFFSVFFDQMNASFISADKAWILFVITSVIICFKNWIQYSGKKRKVMNAKVSARKSKHYSVWLLWLLPIVCIGLTIILSKAN